MNIAIILAGGVGLRMKTSCPKQYILVDGKPIITYCLETFEKHEDIDKIIIVVSEEWKQYVEECVEKYKITKVCGYASAGKTRQQSIYNGLKFIYENVKDTNICIIHDAIRPLVSKEIISDCIIGATEEDGAMPVVSIKDTVYQSTDGKNIDNLLKRAELFAGQAPESFNFKKYFDIHNTVNEEEIKNTTGSSEIAFRYGMKIRLIKGSEKNIKITTIDDLKTFETIIKEEKGRKSK